MPPASPVSTPPLLEGDSLTSDQFLRRWEEIPDLKHAELIDGIVYMPSPLSRAHGDCQMFLAGWLSQYATATPGSFPSMEATWMMGDQQVPQPDLTLRILPEYGGQSEIRGEYHAGAPELIIEVAVSSYSRDFGAKRRLYERMGVREYLIVTPRADHFVAVALTAGGFQAIETDGAGIYRSLCFPGLWLDTMSLWTLNLQGMNAVLQQGLATAAHADFVKQLESKWRARRNSNL